QIATDKTLTRSKRQDGSGSGTGSGACEYGTYESSGYCYDVCPEEDYYFYDGGCIYNPCSGDYEYYVSGSGCFGFCPEGQLDYEGSCYNDCPGDTWEASGNCYSGDCEGWPVDYLTDACLA
ncbi:unnamed protein product, partial [Meganyctiphanes norvegica]